VRVSSLAVFCLLRQLDNPGIIEVRPSEKLSGWIAFETPGVEPAFSGPNGKQDAISFISGFRGNADRMKVKSLQAISGRAIAPRPIS
jgi:hypothetical protein